MNLGKMLAAKEKLTPTDGTFNLVGLDDFDEDRGDGGDGLYLIGNFKTKAEAEAELKKRLSPTADRMFVYGW